MDRPTREREKQILFRVTAEEDEAMRSAAAEVGLDLTNWLRMVTRQAAGLPALRGRRATRRR